MLKDLLPTRGSVPGRRPSNIFDMMEEMWRRPFSLSERFPFEAGEFPSLDISEDEKQIAVKAELPGVDPKDIEITVSQGRLIIKGEKKFEDEEKKDNYHVIERSYGSFQRSVSLPAEVDENKVKANYKDGILTLTMPKSQKSKTVKVKVESK